MEIPSDLTLLCTSTIRSVRHAEGSAVPAVELPPSQVGDETPLDFGDDVKVLIVDDGSSAEDGDGTTDSPSRSATDSSATAHRSDRTRSSSDGSASDGAPVEEGSVVEVTAKSVGDEGDGVGFINGFAIVVDGLDKGETTEAEVTYVDESYALAKPLTDVESA